MITSGKWEYVPHPKENEGFISSEISGIAFYVSHDNGKFIVTCANQCQAVNPSNPQVVAKNIEEMYKALKEITELAPRDKLRLPYAIKVVEIAEQVLSKMERK